MHLLDVLDDGGQRDDRVGTERAVAFGQHRVDLVEQLANLLDRLVDAATTTIRK